MEAGARARRPRIAVVNDDTAFLKLMHDLLSSEGYDTYLHIEGSSAYEAIRRERPDLVVLDIRIEHPEPGWVTLDLLKLDPATTRIPVIVCSADVVQLREKAEHLRAYGCAILEKPFDLERLLAAIERVLAAAQRPDDA